METFYTKWYSPAIGRDMEIKVYGHHGHPVLFIPCQNGHFFDFENFHMTDVWAPWIDSGECMVFAIDTLDEETYSADYDPYWRIRRHEDWMRYIFDEVVPFIREMTMDRNGWDGVPGVIAFGASLGATHAANLYFRRPDLFDGLLALSGIYTSDYGFPGYMDEVVYQNSPVDYLAGMPADHPYIEQYNQHKAVIVVGQGAWEVPESTFRVKEICEQKGIGVWVDIWGYDVKHDWDWWYKQVAVHVPHVL
ncbi:MAG: esterase [Christensenellaceae bacterium]|nr:esterase [Christensenellaceae bacterium]